MSLVSAIIGTAERVPLPGRARHHPRRRFIALCSHTAMRPARTEGGSPFAKEMAARTVAEHADAANIWHHQVPAAFFAKVLGPNLKHSSCFHKEPASTLQEVEEEALRQTVEHADLADNPRNRTHNPVSPQKRSQIQGDSFV